MLGRLILKMSDKELLNIYELEDTVPEQGYITDDYVVKMFISEKEVDFSKYDLDDLIAIRAIGEEILNNIKRHMFNANTGKNAGEFTKDPKWYGKAARVKESLRKGVINLGNYIKKNSKKIRHKDATKEDFERFFYKVFTQCAARHLPKHSFGVVKAKAEKACKKYFGGAWDSEAISDVNYIGK